MPAVKHKPIRKRITVPIYRAKVWVVVVDDIEVERKRKRWVQMFGQPSPSLVNCDGLCSHSGGCTFALFFSRGALKMRIVAHEVFHLTHDIMNWVGEDFAYQHQEPFAYLNGILMEEVHRIVTRDRKLMW